MLLYDMMDAARREQGYPDQETNWSKWINYYRKSPMHTLIEHEHGFLAGTITDSYMLMDNKEVALEIAWYVEPEHRNTGIGMELYKEFEDWVRFMDVKYIIQGRHTKGCTKVGAFYLRELN